MTKISNQYSLTNILTADLANSRLGINNVSPTVALDVTGAGKFSGALTVSGAINLSSSATFPTVGLFSRTSDTTLYMVTATTGFALLDNSQNTMYGATPTSHIWNISNSEKMRITSTGNVGIGTTSPATALAVNGAITILANNNLYLTNTKLGGDTSYNFDINYNTGGTPTMTWYGGTTTSKFVVTSTGNVGIGTSSPVEKLEVVRTTGAGVYIKIQDTVGSNYVGTESGNLVFLNGSASEKMRITSGGNVGIGETSPGQKLTISNGSNNVTSAQFFNYTGDQTATNFISRGARADTFYHIQAFTSTSTEVFRVEASGNVKNATGSYGAISDIKLKENITEATPKLEDLLKVKVCNYNFKGNETKQIGVIAQELEKIFPSMVEESEDRDDNGVFLGTTTKSVKYSIFVPMLIKAIQELSAKVSLLENK